MKKKAGPISAADRPQTLRRAETLAPLSLIMTHENRKCYNFLFHHEHRTTGQADQTLARAAHHAVVERRVAHETDDQQVESLFIDELHDGFDLVADEDIDRAGLSLFVLFEGSNNMTHRVGGTEFLIKEIAA
jgi:hypothetical protein